MHHNVPLSSNSDYVLHHCKPVISPSLCLSPSLFSPLPLSLSRLCFGSRVAVIRGSVVLQDGSPLVGVNISFPQHPEYGYTISRQDGRYKFRHKRHTKKYISNSFSPPNLVAPHFSPALTWWPWAPCLWPWCSSVHPSSLKHEPSGPQITTSWF